MKISEKLSLRYKIIALFIPAVVLPTLLLSVSFTSISKRVLRNSIFSRQLEIARRVADRIDAQITNHWSILDVNRDMVFKPLEQQVKIAKDMLTQGNAFSEIALIDSGGREIWKYRRSGRAKDLISRFRRDEYAQAMSGKSYISPVFFSGARAPYIIFSLPLKQHLGAIVAKLDLDQMWQWISEVKIGETGRAFVVDSKGILIAHWDPARVWAHSNFEELPVVSDFLAQRESTPERWREYRDERGEKVVALYQSLPKLKWAVVTQISSSEVYSPIVSIRKNTLLWTIIWILVFLIAGLRFVRRITDPLSILKSGAQSISQGKLDIKLDIHTGDEIEELARNFEKMAGALKELQELREDLIRMIIHDLKSPLSGIMGGLDYIQSGLIGDVSGEQKNILDIAKKSGENMLSMIQNLLDVAKMEEGKLELKKEKTVLKELFKERYREFEPLMANEKKELVLDIDENLPEIEIDRQLIERVINNLLTNALHHTVSGGTIALKAQKTDGFISVCVSDDGIGIPKEYIDKIFEKFVQVERRQAKLRTGTGLGLTFCKMVVEVHGGSIKVESELNKGSSFIFTLPCSVS